MADFRKLFYAFAIVALFVGFTVSANAQALNCSSINGTNQIIRVEGDAEMIGDIVLACTQATGATSTTPPGTLISGADITVSIPGAIITSKVINPGSSTPISEATLIVDELKDQTCNAPAGGGNALSSGNPIATTGALCENDTVNPPVVGTSNATASYWPGSRPHRVCADTTNPGGLGVCQVYAKASGPQDSYDGTCNNSISVGSNSECNPNIFVGQPNGTGAIIFRGVPLDPPASNFTRYLRITNVRINAANYSGGVGSNVTATVTFQGPASIYQTVISTIVATIQTGNGGTKTTADSSYLQCEYPLYTFSGSADAAVTQDCYNSSSPSSGQGTSSGNLSNTVQQGYCTASLTNSSAGLTFNNNSSAKHAIATFTEGFQSAWKARNMSLYLGTNGLVLGQATPCGAGFIATGTPCNGAAGNNNDYTANSLAYYTYGGLSQPFANTTDIAQNNPTIRYFTEGGFSEISCAGWSNGTGSPAGCAYAAPTSGAAGFTYTGTPWNATTPGAGIPDQGTRLQATLTNLPANVVVSLPTVVWLWNGSINSGVAILVSTTANGGGPLMPIAPLSGLASVQTGVTSNPGVTNPPTNTASSCQGNLTYFGPTNGGPSKQVACAGYVDVSPTNGSFTFTYEVLFSDPYSVESLNIEPVVYYPAGDLTAKPPIQPQTNVWAQVSPYTFAPWIAQPGGNQTTTPLGQVAGTPRFVQTTGTAQNLIYIQNCTCSLLFPFVVSNAQYVTGIVVANTSSDPTNALSVPGYTAIQESGTVNLYLFGTIGGKSGQAASNATNPTVVPAAQYALATDTQAQTGSYAQFVVNTGFEGYAITQANFQYCHGLAFVFTFNNSAPPLSYLGLVMDPAGLTRTTQTTGDPEGN